MPRQNQQKGVVTMALADLTQALSGLNEHQKQEVVQATSRRVKQARKAGGPLDVTFFERTIVEYADEVRRKRKLDEGGLVLVSLNGRNYGEQYLSPRGDN
jgi:hypothetical protein